MEVQQQAPPPAAPAPKPRKAPAPKPRQPRAGAPEPAGDPWASVRKSGTVMQHAVERCAVSTELPQRAAAQLTASAEEAELLRSVQRALSDDPSAPATVGSQHPGVRRRQPQSAVRWSGSADVPAGFVVQQSRAPDEENQSDDGLDDDDDALSFVRFVRRQQASGEHSVRSSHSGYGSVDGRGDEPDASAPFGFSVRTLPVSGCTRDQIHQLGRNYLDCTLHGFAALALNLQSQQYRAHRLPRARPERARDR